MRTIGNILWHIPFCGFITAINTFLLGAFLTLLVVPAPIGLGLIQYSKFLLLPYHYSMASKSDLNIKQNVLWEAYSFIIWLFYLPFGVVLAIAIFFQAIGLCLTIVGIPVAIPLFKSIGTYFQPVGRVCVPHYVANRI